MNSSLETRDSLSKTVSNATGFTHLKCREVLDSLLTEIICNCREGKTVSLHHFGVFKSVKRATRPVYCFPTRSMMPLSEDAILRFYPHGNFLRKFHDEK